MRRGSRGSCTAATGAPFSDVPAPDAKQYYTYVQYVYNQKNGEYEYARSAMENQETAESLLEDNFYGTARTNLENLVTRGALAGDSMTALAAYLNEGNTRL